MPVLRCLLSGWLELDLAGELEDALGVAEGCGGDGSEGAWRGDAGSGASEHGVIEDVERLDVEL